MKAKHNSVYALVVAGGALDDGDITYAKKASLVIAADSGAEFLKSHDFVPHVVVGDFDSTSPSTLDHYRHLKVPILPLIKDKDKTDTEVALDLVAAEGFDTAIVIGAMGGKRLDHELGNVFLIEHYANKGLDLLLQSQDTLVFGLPGEESSYPRARELCQRTIFGKPGDWVTILPLTRKIQGITAANLKFPLNYATLERGSTLSVSNEMLGAEATLKLVSGYALVVFSRR